MLGPNKLIGNAFTAFEKDLPELLKTEANNWAIYRGAKRIAIGETCKEVMDKCRETMGDDFNPEELLLKRIEASEPLRKAP